MALLCLTPACARHATSDTPTTVAGHPHGQYAAGHVTLGGALDLTGDYRVEYPATVASCRSLATARTFLIPLPGRLATTDLQWQAGISDLSGAGSYHLGDLAGLKVTVPPDRAFDQGGSTSATLELKADGSGSFTFAGLHDAQGDELHGTASWSCRRT